jgi:hypothetical protein
LRVCDSLVAEVEGVLIDDPVTPNITWADQGAGMVYDVAGGLISELHPDGGVFGAECLAEDLASPAYVDTRPNPDVGEGYYYIIRSQNDCGVGTYGFATFGAERVPVADCAP